MPSFPFFTVDVFTTARFGGNPLAVVISGETLDAATMQAVAAEFNLSETTFVLPPADPAHTARVRIFNRTAEMAFAGHPMVGTAFVLAGCHPDLAEAKFEIPAGLVHVRIERNTKGDPVGAAITAPQSLTVGEALEREVIASVPRLTTSDVVTTTHPPIVASNGNPYVIAELTDDALARCSPDLDAFRGSACGASAGRQPLIGPCLLPTRAHVARPHVRAAGRHVGGPGDRQRERSARLPPAVAGAGKRGGDVHHPPRRRDGSTEPAARRGTPWCGGHRRHARRRMRIGHARGDHAMTGIASTIKARSLPGDRTIGPNPMLSGSAIRCSCRVAWGWTMAT